MFKFNLIKKYILMFVLCTISYSATVQAKVVSSIKPIAFISAAITAGVTDSDILLPDGASPHTYSLKPSDLIKLKSAELIVWIGEDMEAFLPNILNGIEPNKQIELTELENIQVLLRAGHTHDDDEEHDDHGHEHHHHHGQFDTHIWLSPNIAREIAKGIHQKLRVIYPQHVKVLDKNLHDFLNLLNETEQIIAKRLINVQNSGYFVFHDAFGYFEAPFKLNHLGSFTLNPSVQPGLKKIHEIQTELKKQKAVCIFREPQFSPTIIAKLVDGTDVKVGELDPLGIEISLSKDAYSQFLLKISQQFLDCLE